jgi:hypothetical protein
MNLTKEMFNEWKAHPVTQAVFEEIQKAKDSLKDSMCEGVTIGDTAEKTHGLTNKMLGQIEGLNQLLNISYEEDEEEEISDTQGFPGIIEN